MEGPIAGTSAWTRLVPEPKVRAASLLPKEWLQGVGSFGLMAGFPVFDICVCARGGAHAYDGPHPEEPGDL